jgi:Carboxypeptidase regulatory-like domain
MNRNTFFSRPRFATSLRPGRPLHPLWIIGLLLVCLAGPFAAAQVTATLAGTITDQSGAAISAATVTAKNVDTGLSRSAPTDPEGHYRLFPLAVGEYELRVAKDGFAEGIRTGIRLVVGQEATADLRLRIGQVTEQVKVTGDVPVVTLTTQDISGLVSEREVKDLSLNGRSFDLLVTLNPGVLNFTWEKTGGIGVSNFHYRE